MYCTHFFSFQMSEEINFFNSFATRYVDSISFQMHQTWKKIKKLIYIWSNLIHDYSHYLSQ